MKKILLGVALLIFGWNATAQEPVKKATETKSTEVETRVEKSKTEVKEVPSNPAIKKETTTTTVTSSDGTTTNTVPESVEPAKTTVTKKKITKSTK